MKTAPITLNRAVAIDIAERPPAAFDDVTLADAQTIIDEVRTGGERALRSYAGRFDDLPTDAPILLARADLDQYAASIDADLRSALACAAERIQRFALAQKRALAPVTIDTDFGQIGHTIEPVQSAGCYVPAGRFPLPSTALMTVIAAKTAGVERVIVATPRLNPVTFAAASIAGADGLLLAGGAQAIAALAYGFEDFPPVNIIVGPGNKYVTAAKHIVSRDVGIDMLAGPSELLVIADDTACPETIAADLLAQAEHDTDARVTLVTPDDQLADAVDSALNEQLESLPTADVARTALENARTIVVTDLEEALRVTDRLAPEHLQVITKDATTLARQVRNAGAIFIGAASAEVFGDYGLGPNHTLPTGGTARTSAGLSVFNFLRPRTWMRIDPEANLEPLIAETATLARTEGLEAHARAAEARTAMLSRTGPA